jgi:hypothetical protein
MCGGVDGPPTCGGGGGVGQLSEFPNSTDSLHHTSHGVSCPHTVASTVISSNTILHVKKHN